MSSRQGNLFDDASAPVIRKPGCLPYWSEKWSRWKFEIECNSFCDGYEEIIVKTIPRVLMKSASEPFGSYVIDAPVCRYGSPSGCRSIRKRLRVLEIMLKMMNQDLSSLNVGSQDAAPDGMSGCRISFLSSRIAYRCGAWQACRSLVGDPNDKGVHSNLTTTLAGVQTHTYKCVHLVGEFKFDCGHPLERWRALNKGISAALKKKKVLERRLTA